MITGNNGSRLESWLHAWSMGITRKSKHRTVSHADMSLISLPNDSSSIRHRFFFTKIPRTSFCHRVQKCMIATVTEAHLTAFVPGKKFRFSVHCNGPVLSRVITYLTFITVWKLYTYFIVYEILLYKDTLYVSITA